MEIGTTVYYTDRESWRQWLASNYKTANEVWLVGYKKTSGKLTLPYDEAVEEALCFGWIDSLHKPIEGESFAQRFSPRKTKKGYSPSNVERLKKLVAENKVMPEVLASLPQDILGSLR